MSDIGARLASLEKRLPKRRPTGPLAIVVHPGDDLPRDPGGAIVIDCRNGDEPEQID